MNNRHRLLLVAVACLSLIPLGLSQEPVYVPYQTQTWDNPYPGLGNVAPGTAAENVAPPSVITLYAEQPETESSASALLLSQTPSNQLSKLIQKIELKALWAPDGGSKGLGMTELELAATFGLPLPAPQSALLIKPKFASTMFEAENTAFRGHETFYSTGVDFRWVRPICSNKLTADIGFGVFYNGDFKADASDSLRFPAHAAGIWNMNPRTKVLFGIIYTDSSNDFAWLPMVGIIWTPNDDVNIELLVPRLKIAQRVRWFGSGAGTEQSDWLYTAFEFAGGTWGYEVPADPSISREVEYSDLRFLLGYERRTRFGATIAFELGYMFERELEYEGFGKEDLSDNMFLRLRTTF